ncbi:hypothetical protein EV126DRAFT_36156 [Verticillium dahliae]|nr:hypothetical protein EV126DRAFT_36156 [Verticillium dahliae]
MMSRTARWWVGVTCTCFVSSRPTEKEEERERERCRLVSSRMAPARVWRRTAKGSRATPSGPRLMGLLGPCFPLSLRSEVTGGTPRANEAPRGVLVSDERSQ